MSGTDQPGPSSRNRRRYLPGSARSKTIELGTLSEIEEDMYQNRKELISESASSTRDDSCLSTSSCNTGTVRRPTNGSVRSLARRLSERQKSTNAEISRDSGSVEEMIKRRKSTLELRRQEDKALDERMHEAQRVQRSKSERIPTKMPQPINKWSPSQSEDRWHPSEFHAKPQSTVSRHGSMAGMSISRTPSTVGRLLVYDPRSMALVDPRVSDNRLSDYGVPVWYPMSNPPVYVPLGNPMGGGGSHPGGFMGGPSQLLPYPQKIPSRHKPRSLCSELCCGGIAQLMWTIICIILMGIVATLIIALFYV